MMYVQFQIIDIIFFFIEMLSRGEARALWVGILIAVPSGAGVALSVLGGNAGSLGQYKFIYIE